MFRITLDPSSRSDELYLIELRIMVQLYLLCARSEFGGVCRQTPTTHIISCPLSQISLWEPSNSTAASDMDNYHYQKVGHVGIR